MEFTVGFVLVFIFVSEVGRLASLASLGSLGARFRCGVHSWLRARLLSLCQRWGASRASLRSPRSAPAFIVEFMFVFVVASMFVSGVGRLTGLAWLASLGTRFHCRVHSCFHGCIYASVKGGATGLGVFL